MESTVEQVSKLDIEKLAIHFNLQEDGSFKADYYVQLVGEKQVYAVTLRVDRSVFDVSAPDYHMGGSLLHRLFDVARGHLIEILEGKKELHATV